MCETTLIDEFIHHQSRTKSLSRNTLEAYTLDLKALGNWAEQYDWHLSGLGPAELKIYLNRRLQFGVSPSTLSRQLSSYRRFFSYLVNQGACTINPVPKFSLPIARSQDWVLLEREEVEALLTIAVPPRATAAARYRAGRDQLLIRMLYSTVLSVSEVRLLQWSEIGHGQYRLKRSLVEALGYLRELASLMGNDDLDAPNARPYCFATSVGRAMTRQALNHLIRKRAADCGIGKSVTPSMIRRSGRAHREEQRDAGQTPVRVPASLSGGPATAWRQSASTPE